LKKKKLKTKGEKGIRRGKGRSELGSRKILRVTVINYEIELARKMRTGIGRGVHVENDENNQGKTKGE